MRFTQTLSSISCLNIYGSLSVAISKVNIHEVRIFLKLFLKYGNYITESFEKTMENMSKLI